MKFLKFLSLLAITGFLFSFTVFNYSSVPVHGGDVITWKGEKIAGSHEGTISLKSGDLIFDKSGNLTGGEFTIDMTTMTNTDLKGDYSKQLVGHLSSADFFNVREFPEASFKITGVKEDKSADYLVIGDLTIKGITNELSFPANVKEQHGKKVATAKIEIDRTIYDIKYGSGKFFENLGDNLIKDNFELNVTIEGK